jgi:hypothetical protein
VAARVGILGVDRGGQRPDRGQEELLVLARGALDALEGVLDRPLIRLKFSERSAISAAPVTSTRVPYWPSLTARVDSASWVIGRESCRAKSTPRSRAPVRQIALQITVSRTMRSTDANARSRSRSTRTPHGGSPTGAIDASTMPVGVFSERVTRAGKRTREEACVLRAQLGDRRCVRGRRPASPRVAPQLVLNWDDGLPGDQPSTTPIRLFLSSVTGAARTATVPSSVTPKGPGVPRRPGPTEALAELKSISRE